MSFFRHHHRHPRSNLWTLLPHCKYTEIVYFGFSSCQASLCFIFCNIDKVFSFIIPKIYVLLHLPNILLQLPFTKYFLKKKKRQPEIFEHSYQSTTNFPSLYCSRAYDSISLQYSSHEHFLRGTLLRLTAFWVSHVPFHPLQNYFDPVS